MAQLTLGHLLGNGGNDFYHRGIAGGRGQRQRPRQQVISRQYGRGCIPHLVGHRLTAPQIRAVDHIVVQQGRRVQVFKNDRVADGIRVGVSAQPRGQNHQQRAQPFAAGEKQMPAHLTDQRQIGLQVVDQGLFDRGALREGGRHYFLLEVRHARSQ